MEAKHEILLEQILEELRMQTRALQDLLRRVDELERATSQGRDETKPSIESSER